MTATVALAELKSNIAVMRIEKICTEFPDIQSMKAFIGMFFAGARAASHAFYGVRIELGLIRY